MNYSFMEPGTEPFWLALAIIGIIGVIEIISLVIGSSIMGLMDDTFAPHFDVDHPGPLAAWMSWLNTKGVPILVLFIIILALFSASGFILLEIFSSLRLTTPASITIVLSVLIAIPLTRYVSRGIAAIIPREETYVITEGDYIGLTGTVTLGPVDEYLPGMIQVNDKFGNIHALRAVAKSGEKIETGQKALVIDNINSVFLVIPAPNELI